MKHYRDNKAHVAEQVECTTQSGDARVIAFEPKESRRGPDQDCDWNQAQHEHPRQGAHAQRQREREQGETHAQPVRAV